VFFLFCETGVCFVKSALTYQGAFVKLGVAICYFVFCGVSCFVVCYVCQMLLCFLFHCLAKCCATVICSFFFSCVLSCGRVLYSFVWLLSVMLCYVKHQCAWKHITLVKCHRFVFFILLLLFFQMMCFVKRSIHEVLSRL